MSEATLVIKAAAVADYRPVDVSEQKLKRTGPMTLELAPTEDILAEVVRRRRPGQLIVGFAAETENRMENGRAKLLRKGADAIVVNDVAGEGVGIDADTNAATFLTLSTADRAAGDAQAQAGRPHSRRDSHPAPAALDGAGDWTSSQDENIAPGPGAAAESRCRRRAPAADRGVRRIGARARSRNPRSSGRARCASIATWA